MFSTFGRSMFFSLYFMAIRKLHSPPTNSSGWIKCLWTTGSLSLLNLYSGGVAWGGLPNPPTNRRLLHLRYSKALAYHARDTATEVASVSDPSVRRKGWARIALWHGEEGGVLLEMTWSGGTKIVTTRCWWHRIGQFKVEHQSVGYTCILYHTLSILSIDVQRDIWTRIIGWELGALQSPKMLSWFTKGSPDENRRIIRN